MTAKIMNHARSSIAAASACIISGVLLAALPAGASVRSADRGFSRFDGHRSWIAPVVRTTNIPIVYKSSTNLNVINIYAQASNHKLLGSISTPNTAYSLKMDSEENLWVAGNGFVNMYPRGSTSPTRTLNIPDQHSCSDVAIDSNGTVYAAEYTLPQIDVYALGSNSPTSTLQDTNIRGSASNPYGPFLAVDGANNLYVAYGGVPPSAAGNVDEFPSGSGTPRTILSLPSTPGIPAVDSNGDLVIPMGYLGIPSTPEIDVFPPSATKPSQTIRPPKRALCKRTGCAMSFYEVALGGQDNDLYVSFLDADPIVTGAFEYAYPGGKYEGTIFEHLQTWTATTNYVTTDPLVTPGIW